MQGNMQESYMNTFCTACKHDHVNIVYILTIYSMYSYRNQGMFYSIYTSTATKLSKDARQLRQCCCAASSKIVKRKHSRCSIKLKQTRSIFADKLEEYIVEYIVNIFWYSYEFFQLLYKIILFFAILFWQVTLFVQGIPVVGLHSSTFYVLCWYPVLIEWNWNSLMRNSIKGIIACPCRATTKTQIKC